MLNEAVDNLLGDYNGYQEIMDKISETDWTKQVKQDMSGTPMSNGNGSDFQT